MNYLRHVSIVVTCIVLFFSTSVFAKDISYKKLLRKNAKNIVQIQLGMSESQVRQIMTELTTEVSNGPINNPWKEERIGSTVILHYLVRKHPPFTPILEHQADPVIFQDGKVVATGRSSLASARASAKSSVFDEETDAKPHSYQSRLEELKKLYDLGLIDESEYKSKKVEILDSI